MVGVKVYWHAPIPAACELCSKPIESAFVDGKTSLGPWAIQCDACHRSGLCKGKLGIGFGQRFVRQRDGRYLKQI